MKGYDNFGFLSDENGNLIDVANGGLENLIDKSKPVKTPEKKESSTIKPKEIPEEFLNQNWDELYRNDKLQLVQKEFPSLYEKLKKEKFPNIKI